MTEQTAPPTATPLRSAGRALVRAVRALIWWFNSILGGNDYRRYVQHQRLHHPEREIPSEGEYWRQRHDAADRNPTNRCC
ncbi:YbdD/YjiX family protein [Nocardia crassostreae]|uniref:YbdD/YjiX family protein n=1 Tax=Nocardia crassostreae TaxID=53428 RepID=UPI000830B14E|nr:YbdD/YjiX family protein [Nocardia crassostreae]